MQVDEHTIIGDLLDSDGTCESIFLSVGMPCMGCPASRGETIGEACEIHGVELGELLGRLNRHFEVK